MSDQEKPVGLFKVVLSVLAAMIGVQSSKNRERDFSKGRPAAYIIVGIIFTILFILTLWLVVKFAMRAAGA